MRYTKDMFRNLFYRNINARSNLEVFLVSAVSSLLLLRFYLYVTGYPQVGGGSLHIAHMLWGGLLMMIAIVVNTAFLGSRVERFSAFVGGIGFGVFIDELGKFITKDNDYFFRPTIGLLYALFIILYLAFNFISRPQHLSNEEAQLNALRQFEEAVLHDMDTAEKTAMHDLLNQANPNDPITRELKALLKHVDTVPATKSAWYRTRHRASEAYSTFWQSRNSSRLVAAIFVLQAVLFISLLFFSIYNNFDDLRSLLLGSDTYSSKLIVGQTISSLVAAVFVILGVVALPVSRMKAFEYFRRALLVSIFLTEFFIFARIQFGAIPGLILNLVLLALVNFAIYEEKRVAPSVIPAKAGI